MNITVHTFRKFFLVMCNIVFPIRCLCGNSYNFAGKCGIRFTEGGRVIFVSCYNSLRTILGGFSTIYFRFGLGFVLCYGQSTFRVRIRVMVEFCVCVENTFWVMVRPFPPT